MDIIAEIDQATDLLNKSEVDKARFKLGKIRLAVQNLIQERTDTLTALREAEEHLQAAHSRRIKASQALSTIHGNIAGSDGSKKGNGSRRRK
ncbi:MAG TPA: hypothetical protein VFA51_09555 [Candidatus Udaeobacter sp.]|nr:hypothetical protein [Candidatus Udaeobacter sp.]